jgi:ATP-dependent protease ClpP protease subunit
MKDVYSEMQEALGMTPKIAAAKFAEQRFVPLDGKIDREKSHGICKVLIALDLKEVAPITILISSGGGEVSPSNSIGDTIRTIHSPVDGLVLDFAGSMAVDVLLMCRTRRALPHAKIFVHHTRSHFDVICDSDDLRDSDVDKLRRMMTANKISREDLYMRRLHKTREEVADLFRIGEKYDRDYTAQEALALGFIDEIDTTFKMFDKPEKKRGRPTTKK